MLLLTPSSPSLLFCGCGRHGVLYPGHEAAAAARPPPLLRCCPHQPAYGTGCERIASMNFMKPPACSSS